MDIRIDSVRPPVCKPNSVPRSQTKVEFDITTATVELEITLALAVFHRFTSLNNRQVCVGVAFAYRLHKGETVVEVWRVQVIKEQSANAALFVTMFEIEVFVAPLFITWINVFTKWLAQVTGGAVPVNGVFFKAIEWG